MKATTPPLLALAAITLASSSLHAQSPTEASVSGTFLGEGKDGKIAHLVVQAREPFSNQAAIRLVFSEKDPAKSKKPDFDAGFKKLGSALILSVHRDGGIFGCEVAHSAHEKSPFSALGRIKMEEFAVTATGVSGRVTTGGEISSFGQSWNVDLVFSAPLPQGAFAEEEGGKEKEAKPMAKAEAPEKPAAATGPKLAVAELPLPSSAADLQYKAAVGHIEFRSGAAVSEVAAEFAGKLEEQGWKDGGGSLVGKANAILRREREGAKLTVMVQPAAGGSSVKVFTEGLDWSNAPTSGAASPAPAVPTDAAGIEAEVQRKLQEALKGLPGL